MKIHKINNHSEFEVFLQKSNDVYKKHLDLINKSIPPDARDFQFKGFSYTAQQEVSFHCDFAYSEGYPAVNWRERVVCPVTGLNNRTRAAVHFFELVSNTFHDDPIFIFEQTTALYSHLKKSYPNLVGAEFLGNTVPLGAADHRGIRNEDARSLSFPDNHFRAILSFDVFEHIFDHRKALAECCRVLAPGGCMLFTVPFKPHSSAHIERALELSTGEIRHILPPEYHGDPLSGDGILCFRHFGWNLLDDLRRAGFAEAHAAVFHSEAMGYCTNQIIFYCQK
jgi:hypothetical protein